MRVTVWANSSGITESAGNQRSKFSLKSIIVLIRKKNFVRKLQFGSSVKIFAWIQYADLWESPIECTKLASELTFLRVTIIITTSPGDGDGKVHGFSGQLRRKLPA
ncbi:hypothetical protein ElyMa_000585600 [Elysia marginata]|uniref:Uncharacterized protein n=1 Tax=Elysia marginata TaxID=1093978 RepID=A0AAV4G4X5_9GAST|nr:hypothetical protein ElyMa_000585600 [Elysia marginata]